MNNPDGLRSLFAVVTVVVVCGFCAAAGAALRPAVNGTSISDAVESELSRDQAVPAYRLDVMTTDGVVTLVYVVVAVGHQIKNIPL